AVALSQSGQRGKDQRLRDLTEAFVIEKEEGVVFNNGAAECEAELIANQRWLDAAHRFEKTHGVQGRVAIVFPQIAVKLIRAAAVGSVDDRAAAASELCAVGVGLHFEFGDGVGRDLHHLARKALVAGSVGVVVYPVEQEVVERVAQPVDVERGFAAGGSDAVLRRFMDAGSEQGEVGVRAPVERQVNDLFALDNLAAHARIGFEQLRRVGDDDAFSHRAGLHRQIDALAGVDRHVDALGDRRRKALFLGAHAVIADSDVGELKIAVAVRLRSDAQPRVNVLQGDGHAGYRRPVRIVDRAEHGGRVELRKGRVHGGNKQQTQERDQTSEFATDGDSHVSSPYRDGFVDRLRPRLPNSDVMLRSRDYLQVVSL